MVLEYFTRSRPELSENAGQRILFLVHLVFFIYPILSSIFLMQIFVPQLVRRLQCRSFEPKAIQNIQIYKISLMETFIYIKKCLQTFRFHPHIQINIGILQNDFIYSNGNYLNYFNFNNI